MTTLHFKQAGFGFIPEIGFRAVRLSAILWRQGGTGYSLGTRQNDGWVMLRRIFFLLLIAAIAGLAAYGWLTAVPKPIAVAAKVHAPNPANGGTIFNAGGCSSCHP